MDSVKTEVAVVPTATANVGEYETRRLDVHNVECPVDKRTAAKLLGVSTDTLDAWTVRYAIPHYKCDMEANSGNRGKVVYMASDVLEFRERFRVEGQNVQAEVDRMLSDIERN